MILAHFTFYSKRTKKSATPNDVLAFYCPYLRLLWVVPSTQMYVKLQTYHPDALPTQLNPLLPFQD